MAAENSFVLAILHVTIQMALALSGNRSSKDSDTLFDPVSW
jgi:hypothetical protein